jgi:hypothetical protein
MCVGTCFLMCLLKCLMCDSMRVCAVYACVCAGVCVCVLCVCLGFISD